MDAVAYGLITLVLTGAPVPNTTAPPGMNSADESAAPHAVPASSKHDALLGYMADELEYSLANLVAPDGSRPYFINYTVYDEHSAVLSATLGALTQDYSAADRNLNIDLRVGDYALDNTHQIRGRGDSHSGGSGNVPLPLQNDEYAIRHALWYHTDQNFKGAVKRLTQVHADLKIKVEEEDQSADFSREEPRQHDEALLSLDFEAEPWKQRIRRISAIARGFPFIYSSSVTVSAYASNRFMVTSEGTRLQTAERRYRVILRAATKADDGMDLTQSFDFNSASLGGLPEDDEIEGAFREVIKQVLALRAAPIAEPYIGPAILRNRASGVFFHEIFGHRIEGHRQKDVTEGQTFTKKIGEIILPEFLTVVDDPTLPRLADIDLRGHYRFDDEGVKASRTPLVENGILKSFLLSRSPVHGFPQSNGHGRRQPGRAVTSRQANLIVESSNRVSFDELRQLLKDEADSQGKPYGLLFEDISGGFTRTGRRGPQSFKVLPVEVYRVYTDGRPDELIRGADIVGTPLTCFEKVTYTADDPGVFNGSCGAESGWVPVSAVSPSILVSTIEIEKRTRDQSRPPILDPPLDGAS